MWDSNADKELSRIFCELLRFDSSNPPGREKEIISYIAALLIKDGIKSRIIAKDEKRPNLYAQLEGGNGTPVILLSHIDVKPAESSNWKHPPFEAVLDDGFIYGRGALDTKQLTAMELMVLLLLKRENITLSAPVILIAAADEENGSTYGMQFISGKYPELLPKGFVINEGGGFVLCQDGQNFRTITCGEKGHFKLKLTLNKEHGSSSLDPASSTQGRLLEVMMRISDYEAPEELRCSTKRFLEIAPRPHSNQTLYNLWEYSSRSCLAVDGFDLNFGFADDKVELKIDYQCLPGTPQAENETLMMKLLDGLPASYNVESISDGFECDIENPLYRKLEEVSSEHDKKTKMLPIFALGQTDGRFIRHNVYGYSPLLADMPFSHVLKKVHQKDECITEASLCFGGRVLYEAIRGIATQKHDT